MSTSAPLTALALLDAMAAGDFSAPGPEAVDASPELRAGARSAEKCRELLFSTEQAANVLTRRVTEIYADHEAMAVAAKIAAKSPAMIRIAKEALTGIEDGNLEAKYRWEQGFTLQAYLSPDSAETRRAFVEKREAKF